MSLFRPTVFLAAIALLAGCVGEPGVRPTSTDDDDGDDDAADDDDVTNEFPSLNGASFAASLQGETIDGGDPERPVTLLRGQFQLLYWSEAQSAPVCRFFYNVNGWAAYESSLEEHCVGCVGEVTFDRTRMVEVEGGEPCLDLPADVDLGFLLNEESDTLDLRSLLLVSVRALREDVDLGQGLSTRAVIDAYAASGFAVEYFAMVSAEGWMAKHAGLGTLATPWNEDGHLPMFVIYRAMGDEASYLRGDTFVAGLWTLTVGADATSR